MGLNIEQIEDLMKEYGLAVHCVPSVVTRVLDVKHKDRFPEGRVEFLKRCGGDRLIVDKIPSNTGKFMVTLENPFGTGCRGKRNYFDTIEEAVLDFIKTAKKKEEVK